MNMIKTCADNAVPHKVYDLSIENLQERKERALPFKSAMAVANYLGILPKRVYESRKPGRTVSSPVHNKRFAIRIA